MPYHKELLSIIIQSSGNSDNMLIVSHAEIFLVIISVPPVSQF